MQTKRQKSPFLFILIAGSLALWLIFAGLFFYAIDRTYRQNLESLMGTSRQQMEQNTQNTAAGILLEVEKLTPTHPNSIEQLQTLLPKMQNGENCYAVDGAGSLYDNAGQVLHMLDTGLLEETTRRGYAIAELPGAGGREPGIVLLAQVTDEPKLYVAQLFSPAAYADIVLQHLRIPAGATALYGSGGLPLVQTGNTSNAARLAKAAEGFIGRSDEGVSRDGLFLSYTVYLPFPAPAGWAWAAHIPASVIISEHAAMLRITVLPVGLWLVLLIVFIFSHLFSRRRIRTQVLQASQLDPLTGLANNAGMNVGLQRYFKRRSMVGHSLVCVDISAFHRFNTMYGYANGDALLRCVGKVISTTYACGTRTSSDIFVFVAPSAQTLPHEAEQLLNQAVCDSMGEQFASVVNFKLGVFPILNDSHTLREIYDGALLALRDAKKHPKNNAVVYDHQLQQRSDLHKKIEVNMLGALSGGEFLVYIQPKFRVSDGLFCGGEALIRWKSEVMGFLTPDDFVPLFEGNGFIVELDFFMMEEVLKLLQYQHERKLPIAPISVNQSRITLTFPGYLERLEKLLAHYDVPLEYLEIEITEGALADEFDRIVELVNAFKRLGLSVSLDDFGSGYSSLNTLRLLPVDILKIDKGFLDESSTLPRSRTIIEHVINLSHGLGMGVVCEGVETSEQLEFLKQAGCDTLQGFLFSKALFFKDYLELYVLKNKAGDAPNEPEEN